MVGGEEFQNEKIILKKMATGESKEFSLDDTDGILNLISKSEYEDEIEE
jgi:histidyl-tRNA synthetase